MANLIAIVGESGTGKTSSILPIPEVNIKGLDPKTTIICTASSKPLPVRKANSLYPMGKLSDGKTHVPVDSFAAIKKVLELIDREDKYKHIKDVVIDDSQYFQGFLFMDLITDKGYDKFNSVGEAGYIPIKTAKEMKRRDINIFFIYHSEESRNGLKIKTAGKVVDNYMTLEGLFTFVLFTEVNTNAEGKRVYSFITQNTGHNTAKSPVGCFETLLIPNDLGYVSEQIKEYYEM